MCFNPVGIENSCRGWFRSERASIIATEAKTFPQLPFKLVLQTDSMTPGFVRGFSTIFFLLVSTCGFAQNSTDVVVATVGDQKIFASQIEHEIQSQFSERGVNDRLETGLRSRILQRLIKQQLVLARFDGSEVLATDDEVNLKISRLREQLQRTDRNLESFLKENHLSMAGLEFNFRWQVSWKRYLDRTLTDAVLEKYFDRHRRRFDGTQIKAAHILWQEADNDPDTTDALGSDATRIRQQIGSGSLSWNEAAAQHSAAPSAAKEGNVGWINFDGPMSRNFTEAAFDLEIEEISQPIRTPFGIHLIKCLDIRRGTIPWYEVKGDIRKIATNELFSRISEKQRTKTEIRVEDTTTNEDGSGLSSR